MTTAWTGEPHRERPAYKVNFDAEIKGPVEVKIVEPPKRKPPKMPHREAVWVAWISLVLVVTLVVSVLVIVTPNLYNP